MAHRKSTPSKRPLAPPPCTPKRLKRAKASRHQRTEPLPLSCSGADDGWGEADVLWLQFPAPPSLTVAVKDEAALQLRVNLTLVENDQVILQPRGREGAGVSNQLSLTELFPDTYDAWKLHIATLAERGLLRLHADGKREKAADAWSFSLSFGVAWRKYMETCIAQGWTPTVAAPRAAPMRAMHHVMIWLLKKTHDAQGDELMCKFRYWKEIEVMYDRFVGDNSCECSKFKDDTFAMPEIYAYIDAERQLTRDFGEYEAIESNSSGLLPTLRRYQKAAVSWMLSRENPSRHCDRTLPLCITFSEAINSVLQAYDPFCAVFHATSSSDTLLLEQFRPVRQDFSSIRGGILADEMGLGKTVEVIALVLNHRSVLLKPRLLSTHTLRGNQDDNEGDGVQDDVIACICGSPDNHPMGLVQCAFCGTWHHQLCTGYVTGDDSEQSSISSNSHNVWDFETCESISAEEESKWTTIGFMCYHCQSHERPSFSCRTTLVVSPEPIHAQWEREISRHVSAGALSVMRYPGVRAVRARLESVGPSAEWQVLASPGLVLSRYDVVLTTYEALGADLRHVPTPEGGNRRSSTRSQHKRYAFVSSPLVALHFWRVCMDEAQVGVENTRLQAALTLSRLSADNRWVVTGTPFSSHVSELFGYLRFLRIPPYTSSASHQSEDNLQLLQSEHNERESVDLGFFRESVEHSFIRGAIERVLELLLWNGHDADSVTENGGGILWRTGKKHVVDQLGLPPQTNEVIWCRFAAVERHFYDQQEKRIVSLIQQRQRQRHQLDQSKDTIALDDRLWEDLLILRQLCCHPQVGGARQAWGYGGNSTGRTVMTMDAFLQGLLTKAIRECEEAQRELIGAHNGLAALLVLNNDFSGAALKYMAEMSSIRANWSKFRADLLPRLHILENLEKCVRKLYTLPLSPAGFDAGIVSSENAKPTADPRKMCLLPDLPTLDKRISSSGLLPETEDLRDEDRISIARECALLKQNARHIRQFYLFQTDAMHAKAFHDFKMIFDQIDENREYSGAQPEMLCTSGTWWNDALAVVEENEQKSELQLITRIHARLSGFDTRWGKLFCSQLVSSRSLRLLLVRELEGLAKRRRVLFKRLAALSEGTPTADEVELSGNCAKCRDGGSGPICVHCQLYKELDAYRQHFLGIDKSLATNSRFIDTPDDQNGSDYDDESTGAVPHKSGGGLSVSLFVEVF
ncbi:unnamed protein product [Phytophthora lilii]|uniref:Unnamed protein product n=1 Tax=Phytophthora lilii TaxID=2077276 RepID=A0A9W6TBI7_9STRA|nr:unnamed protein product [Phytophthora lilii]